jgi:hypothetical protein
MMRRTQNSHEHKYYTDVMNIWLDDERNPNKFRPDKTWVWVKSYNGFVSLINQLKQVEEISFDHDLADVAGTDRREKTGLDALNYLEELWLDEKITVDQISVHTANPYARKIMQTVADKLNGRFS